MNNPTTWLNLIWKSDLPSHSKYLAAYLRRFMNDDSDMAYPSLARITCETGLAKSTAVKYLNVLQERGFLLRESGNSVKSTRYISNIPTECLGSSRDGLRSSRDGLGVVRETDTNKQRLNKQSNKQDKINPSFVVDQYNAFCTKLPKIRALTESRKKSIHARCSILKTEDDWVSYFKMVAKSSFLTGINNKGWKPSFDWLINETNMAKVLEGNYSDTVQQENKPNRDFPI